MPLDILRRHPAGGIAILLAGLLLGCAIASFGNPDFPFFTQLSLATLQRSIIQVGVISIGVGLLMISGEFDLSVGFTFTISALVMAQALNAGAPVGLALICSLGVAAVIGAVNAFIVLGFGITSFIATLSTMFILKGLILFVSGSQSQSFSPPAWFKELVAGSYMGVQAGFIWLLVLAIAAYVLLERSVFGNHLYAVGGNRAAAVAIGVRDKRVKASVFVLASMLAAVSGVLSTTRISAVSPIQGGGLELQAIAVCVIGGIALTGGRGSIWGVLAASIFLATMQHVLFLSGAPAFYLDLFVGTLIAAAIILNKFVQVEN